MTIKKQIKKLRLVNFLKILGLKQVKQLVILDGVIGEFDIRNQGNDFTTIDLSNCIIAPGFIDPQLNGFGEFSFWDLPLTFEQIDNLRLKLALSGIVAFCPTIITTQTEKAIQSIDFINSYIKQTSNSSGAKILGIHLEGFFISKYGVHNPEYISKELTKENLRPLLKDNIVLFTLAPELDRTGEAINYLKNKNVLVSIGHSNANYLEGNKVIQNYNLKTVTHMFNCLRGVEGFSHRGNDKSNLDILLSKLENENAIDSAKDGIILSVLKNKNILCMVIADGLHVSRDVIDFLFKYKGKEYISLTTDLVSTKFYTQMNLVGQLGGGQTTLDKCVLNLAKWKILSLEDALLCASRSISKQLKVASDIGLGEINYGKEANLVLWNTKDSTVKGTIIGENVFLNY